MRKLISGSMGGSRYLKIPAVAYREYMKAIVDVSSDLIVEYGYDEKGVIVITISQGHIEIKKEGFKKSNIKLVGR